MFDLKWLSTRPRRWWLWVGAAALGAAAVGAWQWPRLRTFLPQPLLTSPPAAAGADHSLLFLHHSVGSGLIDEGGLRRELAARGYQLWDHGYNYQGLVAPDGTAVGGSYRLPGNLGRGDTDVPALADLFTQPVSDPPTNAFSRLLQHEVILVKSCFPNNALTSDEMAAEYRADYEAMRAVIADHPEHLFILLTTPPLHPLATTADAAQRAADMAAWLGSDAFRQELVNLAVYDLFAALADPQTHTLRDVYQRDPNKPDSHPNFVANALIGPQLAAFVDTAVTTYRHPHP